MFMNSFFNSAMLAAATMASQAAAHPNLNTIRSLSSNLASTNASLPVKSLGSLSLPNPGFASLLPQNGSPTLFISSFHPFGTDSVYRIPASSLDTSTNLSPTTPKALIPGSITWPNDITYAPASLFGTEGILVGGGFLVPGKSNGGLYYSPTTADGTSATWMELISSNSGWFYHRAIVADIDNDGHEEIVSCRANKPLLFGSTSTMLVYLKRSPQAQGGSGSSSSSTWIETELGPGCDALFTLADLDGDHIPEIIAASFFTSELNLFHSHASTGFKNSEDVSMVTLDRGIGAPFDVQVADLQGDGRLELLVSNHHGDGSGGVFAYEIPPPAPTTTTNGGGGGGILDPSAYKRHTLASGFPVTEGGFNQAAPGSALAFFPTEDSRRNRRMYIALAGDAAQIAYVLVPEDGNDGWGYRTTVLHDCGGTVGKLAVGDVDGDGAVEVFVPCYDGGILVGYSFGV